MMVKQIRTRILFFIGVSCMMIFYSCRKDNNLHLDMGYGYSPSVVGRFIIYDVDSTVYREFNRDTLYFKYQLKEYVESVFPDNQGRPSLRIERYTRAYNPSVPYSSIPWTLKNVWYSTLTNTNMERVESNIRYVKLIFPLNNNAKWNGNAKNTFGDWEYQYKGVNLPQSFSTLSFDSTATVIQKDDTNRLYIRYYKEVYAKNIGVVFKTILDVYDTQILFTPVTSRIKGGIYYSQKINSFGQQ